MESEQELRNTEELTSVSPSRVAKEADRLEREREF